MNFDNIKGKAFSNIEIGPYTTFKIGGKVKNLVLCEDIEDLKTVIKICKEEQKEVFVLGAGSNILFKSDEHDLVVIKLTGKDFSNIFEKDNVLTVGAGMSLSQTILFSAAKGLKGLEIFAGIPATVGGAVYMNAGSDKWICSFIKKVILMDMEGNLFEVTKKQLNPVYRSSGLKNNIILQVEFELEKDLPENVMCQYKKILENKKDIQPIDKNSAGCVFKNPDLQGISAGKIIDECGLKGFTKGGAEVSSKHANFIVNQNNASFEDVLFLIKKIKEVVKKNKNIELEMEIIIV
ncbi:MAG: UDP-N-acetylmuramate dehydrogenase [Candidatus Omnitrophica bacterium]|nr:UDP-N-acetylmuramate dehydrogenase [Candidatus Omnitrophota bacterium]